MFVKHSNSMRSFKFQKGSDFDRYTHGASAIAEVVLAKFRQFHETTSNRMRREVRKLRQEGQDVPEFKDDMASEDEGLDHWSDYDDDDDEKRAEFCKR